MPPMDPEIVKEGLAEAHDVAAAQSAHPTHKIGVVAHLENGVRMASANVWLRHFSSDFDAKVRVGSSSPSKHAETALLAKLSQAGEKAQGATLYITDPPCPNCMNGLAAAGVGHIVMDRAGVEGGSAWYQKRARHFDQTSRQIAANAGISLWVAARQDGVVTSVPGLKPTCDFDPSAMFTVEDTLLSRDDLSPWLSGDAVPPCLDEGEAWAMLCLPVQAEGGGYRILTARTATTLVDGDRKRLMAASEGWSDLSADKQLAELEKYKRQIYPLDFARFICARLGLEIREGAHIVSSCVPASRELVNMCDVLPYIQLHVRDDTQCWMAEDKQALQRFLGVGAGLRLPPVRRKTNDVVNEITGSTP